MEELLSPLQLVRGPHAAQQCQEEEAVHKSKETAMC